MYRDTSSKKQNIVNDIESLLSMYDDGYNQLVAMGKKVGADNLYAMLDELGGQKPHIPTAEKFRDNLAREYRNKLMRDKFNPRDYGYSQLAVEYSNFMGLPRLSERHVRQIVHKRKKEYQKKRENYRPVKVHNEVHKQVVELSEKYGAAIHAILDVLITVAINDDKTGAALDKIFGHQLRMNEEMSA